MTDKVFEIGVTMAGAISAGAYSAGVFDFLIQALEEWEKAKATDPASVPNHSVCIKVLTGASAGSIISALAPAALAAGALPAAMQPKPDENSQPYKYILPALYAAWVEKPDMALGNGVTDLLSNDDLVVGEPVTSLLNSKLLDNIGDAALRLDAAQNTKKKIPYISERLHLYLSISNLRGVPYKVTFKDAGAIKGHGMLSHGDRAHYVITGLGSADIKSAWADSDTFKEADIKTLPVPGTKMNEFWNDYLQAALASSAFPIGLASRQLNRDTNDYKTRTWALNHEHNIEPDWPESWYAGTNRAYNFINIDGGMINNEPFEYAHYSLLAEGSEMNERDADKADRAVIMIDPFPESPYFEMNDAKLDRSLVTIVKSLLGVLKDQARFKPTELAAALDETIYSRFLIAPRRANPDGSLNNFGIATGLLGGFGGFLDRSLRDFDYQLGRRNCQKFLSDAFLLDASNSLFSDWPAQLKTDARFNIKNSNGTFSPVIPLLGTALKPVPLPQWPKLSIARISEIENRIEQRAKVLIPRLIEEQLSNRFLKWGGKLLWSGFGTGMLNEYIHLTIQQDLIQRDQHSDWALGNDDERKVMACLSDPAFDYVTVQGISATSSVKQDEVLAILNKYSKTIYKAEKVSPTKADGYTLLSRKPSWFSRNATYFTGKPAIG